MNCDSKKREREREREVYLVYYWDQQMHKIYTLIIFYIS